MKYKDINGDGIIDGNDKVAIGATTKPIDLWIWYVS